MTQLECCVETMLETNAVGASFLLQEGDLYFYAIAHFLKHHSIHATNGLSVRLSSFIPIGSGMGSSAATLAALYAALYTHFSLPIINMSLFIT